MSFTQDVKEEMLKNAPVSTYQLKYELEAFFHHTVTFIDKDSILYKSENKLATLRFLDNLLTIYGISLHSLFEFNAPRKTSYECEITHPELFNDAFLANTTLFNIDEMSTEHKKIYIQATFLISGCILDPEKNYHIEVSFNDKIHADLFCNLLKEFGVFMKPMNRKKQLILYVKDSEQISKFLGILNAYTALLNMENIKIYKDVRNSINRNVNCETANLKKTIDASVKQVNAIIAIDKIKGINSLPKPLYDVAEARLQNRDISLQELAKLLEISKSCLNHRLRKLIQISEELR